MPGIWKGRMFSGLGFGSTANILYGIINAIISLTLFIYRYGLEGLIENGIYLGGLFVLVSYFVVGKLCYAYFHRRYFEKRRV